MSNEASVEARAREDFLTQLRRVNYERYIALVEGSDAGMMFDALELGGEVGELLNVVKKLEREERGWRGSRASTQDFADECADVLICLDKLARRRGVNLADATIAKFNATSDKQGFSDKLAALTQSNASPTQPGDVTIHLTVAEIKSGHDRVRWAEGLILQLPEKHDGRNSWLLNYGKSEEADDIRKRWEKEHNRPITLSAPPAAQSNASPEDAVEAEREACAKVVDAFAGGQEQMADEEGWDDGLRAGHDTARIIAKRIRARKPASSEGI